MYLHTTCTLYLYTTGYYCNCIILLAHYIVHYYILLYLHTTAYYCTRILFAHYTCILLSLQTTCTQLDTNLYTTVYYYICVLQTQYNCTILDTNLYNNGNGHTCYCILPLHYCILFLFYQWPIESTVQQCNGTVNYHITVWYCRVDSTIYYHYTTVQCILPEHSRIILQLYITTLQLSVSTSSYALYKSSLVNITNIFLSF